MPKVIKLKKGLDISLVGEALSELNELPLQREYALVPDNFRGVVPKMLVKEGEEVKAGTPLFFDKYHPEVLFCSPVSGTLAGVVRGAKRKILKVVVQAAQEQRYETFDLPALEQADKEVVSAALLKAGGSSTSLWHYRRCADYSEGNFRFRFRFGAVGPGYGLSVGWPAR